MVVPAPGLDSSCSVPPTSDYPFVHPPKTQRTPGRMHFRVEAFAVVFDNAIR